MTGTSMDGLDIVIADIQLNDNVHYQIINEVCIPYPIDLKEQIRQAVYNPEKDHFKLNDYLGQWYADTLFNYLQSKKINNIELIGSHGQTINHISGKLSLQIGAPHHMAKKLSVPVISDFRNADINAGGTVGPDKVLVYDSNEATNWKWADQSGSASSGANVSIALNAPATPTAGDLWWKTDEGSLKIHYDDGGSTQWVDASPHLAQTYLDDGANTNFSQTIDFADKVTSELDNCVSFHSKISKKKRTENLNLLNH